MRRGGFSLVEIAISLGIFSFCLLAVIGLFASGLKTEQQSEDEEGATSALTSFGIALENSRENADGTHSAAPPLESLTWDSKIGTSTTGISGDYAYWIRLQPEERAGDTRFVVARLELAWPADRVQWSNDGQASSARGKAGRSMLFFLR